MKLRDKMRAYGIDVPSPLWADGEDHECYTIDGKRAYYRISICCTYAEYESEGKEIEKWEKGESTKTGITINDCLVKRIAEWILSSALLPQPQLSLAAALAFVGMLKGHRIAGRTQLRTNVLMLSLSPTGSGKEHPQSCLRRLAKFCGINKHMLGEPVSGGGFLTGLKNSGRIGLLVMDEIGRYIGNLSHKNSGSHQREIIDYIIKTFSCASSTLIGRQYADETKSPKIDIEQPHFCCVGSTVKERLQAACTSSEVIDGFLNRWLVFSGDENVQENFDVKYSAPPEALVKEIKEYYARGAVLNPYGDPEPRVVDFSPEAWDIFLDYKKRMKAEMKRSGYPMDKLYSRSAEHAEKIALILCDDEDIMASDMRSAIEIVDASNKQVLKFSSFIADNSNEQDYIKVREIIREAGEINKSALTRKTQFISGGRRRREEILNDLEESCDIIITQTATSTTYRIA